MAAAIAGKSGASTRDAIKAGVIAGLTSQAFTQAGTAITGLGMSAKMLSHGDGRRREFWTAGRFI